MLYNFDLLLETKNEKVALLEIRSHAAWYFKGIPGSKEIKEQIMKIKTKEEFINLLDEMKK